MTDLIIGSGPSGIATATALLARGRSVVLLDGGKLPEPEAIARRDALAARAPEDWSQPERTAYQAPQFAAPEGQTRRYGSDFAQEAAADTLAEGRDGFALRASRAVGGLSNLWGAAVLPYRQHDIADWPVTAEELAPHYRAVAGFMPIAGREDALDNLLPGYLAPAATQIPPPPQAEALLARLDAKRDRLRAMGFHTGAARQAVEAGCIRCGMCLHGCPWGHIYSARKTLETLKAHPRFTYRPGALVAGFSETEDGVTLALADGRTVTGTRVFIGAGVLETARLMLASAPGTPRELILKDSQHAFLPLLHRWRTKLRPDRPPHHTLPQLFAEIEHPDVSDRLVHAQFYTWNEHYARDLLQNYGARLPGSAPLLKAMSRRLIVAQIFLHSDHSARIGLSLAADGRLNARVEANPDTGRVLDAAKRKLSRAMAQAGLVALGFAARPGAPGSSFHVGGTVPMAAAPAPGRSDRLGRPHGLRRVHIVDASVLPSIPATTITFSVMANAHRIGAEAP